VEAYRLGHIFGITFFALQPCNKIYKNWICTIKHTLESNVHNNFVSSWT